jgi:mono/diheme cytochrome c family protein
VHSDPRITADAARRHRASYRLPFPVLLDPEQRLARQIGATRTLEVAVVSAAGAVVYRGRVDDRTVDFGKSRPQAIRHDLRLALDEVLAGKAVSVPLTKAIGCAIPFPAKPAAAPSVTYTRDVAPLLARHCASCHRPGESAPFPLLTYDDASKRAALIAAVATSRYMPPWLPAPGYGKFQHERRLSDAQLATLRHWAATGAPRGAGLEVKPALSSTEQPLGAADLTATMRTVYEIPGDGPDQYRCFSVPLGLDRDRYVRAIDIRPGNRKVAHHALVFQDLTGTARKRDQGSGYDCFGSPGFLPARGLGGWTPGGLPVRMPSGIPEVLYKGADIVIQMHYHPTGKPETDRTSVRLYFTEKAPERRMFDVALGSNAIDIPAGERQYRVSDHFTLPVDVDAYGIIPHAHYVCKEMKGIAILPDGRRIWLIRIPDWNFDWQEQFRYREPVRLPAGTRLEMEFVYDNSAENPRNPSQPPARVKWGPGATDEMAGLHLQVVPVDAADAEELGQALWGKMMRSIGGGIYRPPR